jgi:hypothetical protein
MSAEEAWRLIALERQRARANGDWNINDWKDFARVLALNLDTLAARVAELEKIVNCEHNWRTGIDVADRVWDYIEHVGKTWNRCRICGLLELWEGGMFVRAALVAKQEGEA